MGVQSVKNFIFLLTVSNSRNILYSTRGKRDKKMSSATTTQSESTKQIMQAVQLIMGDACYVQKQLPAENNGSLRYRYASEAAIVGLLHEPMAKYGLSVRPVMIEFLVNDVFLTKHKTESRRTVLSVVYRFSHTSGEWFDVLAIGEANDAGDKSIAKAMTMAYKYALRQSFMIETGDDPDEQQGDENDVGPQQKQQQAQQQQQPAQQRQQPTQQQPAGSGSKELTADEKFHRRKTAIANCQTIIDLNKWREAYSKDKSMTKDQVKALEEVYWKRSGELNPPEQESGQGEMFPENYDSDPVDTTSTKH